MKAMPARPIHVEVLVDESGAIAIHGFSKFDRFLLGLARGLQPSDSLLKGRVDENMKGIRPFAEIVCGTSADNHAFAGIRDFWQESLNDFLDIFRVHYLQSGGV